jgi:hypothetical protein
MSVKSNTFTHPRDLVGTYWSRHCGTTTPHRFVSHALAVNSTALAVNSPAQVVNSPPEEGAHSPSWPTALTIIITIGLFCYLSGGDWCLLWRDAWWTQQYSSGWGRRQVTRWGGVSPHHRCRMGYCRQTDIVTYICIYIYTYVRSVSSYKRGWALSPPRLRRADR